MDFINNSTLVYSLIGVAVVANLVTIPASIKNIIKRGMGVLWVIMGIFAEYTLFSEGMKKINAATGAAGTQTVIQWTIILIIFTIVMIGLILHGVYAATGQYSDNE